MIRPEVTRRTFLRNTGELLGIAWVNLDWLQIAQAAEDAQKAAGSPENAKLSFFAPADAADIEALTAQIIPTDDTAGAREAGVVYFIDRALASFFAHLAARFSAQFLEFQRTCRAAYPGSRFADWPSAQQIEFLASIEQTPFFDAVRTLTVFGMFSLPFYGGNRGQLGWKLLGFEDQHVFEPPFGYYDRDYTGFALDPPESA